MSSNKNKGNSPIVYSTNPDFKPLGENEYEETLAPNQQLLNVSLERLKGNKMATVIDNFIGTADDLNDLGKLLKTKCGVGGSSKDGVIIIQGEKRDIVMNLLQEKGYKVKKRGG